eukprot:CAMPEP_0195122990 /NCGR_PEP_ID=MMETSP0448-20130528/127719_1 /TAXON_ID=66468 /ORGANISM="Heterocapsa triquestra, Strain CCMP 448" /LENGTH=35 /DNA_ID= /DNA_START= /DNA_END= /DNA_ORIENTATION=
MTKPLFVLLLMRAAFSVGRMCARFAVKRSAVRQSA